MKRRQFIGDLAKATAGLSVAAGGVRGANELVRLGWIGCGGRGRFLAGHLLRMPDVRITAVCDIYDRQAERAKLLVGPHCETCGDFRRILDRKDIDAVLVATPDHWHAVPTVLACEAGKDVYVEKPLAHNVAEGRAMVRAARRHDRVVQTGTQQRSAAHFERVRAIVQSGQLGPVHYVRIWNYRNAYPRGIGHVEDSPPPPGLDWDFYLGPAPMRPYNQSRYDRFRYFWDYAGGVPTDWGTHRFDVLHLIMGVDAPETVSAAGGRFALEDDAEVPDVLQATYEYPGFVLSYEASTLNAFGCGARTAGMKYYHANGTHDRPNGMAFYGTNGTLMADRLGFEIYPELRPGRKATTDDGGSLERFRMERQEGFTPDSTALHVENFIDCVRTRKPPVADVEHGHRATTVAHLGNIAYRTGRKLRWDSANEQIVDDPGASQLLARRARSPWDLI